MRRNTFGNSYIAPIFVAAWALSVLSGAPAARGEYGDVVMNRYCDEAGVAPVVFPHWFHRIRYRCKVCHGDLGFALEAGGNDVNMLSIIEGQHCGACHNGDAAWSTERCDLCHTGKAGLVTQTQKGVPLKFSPPAARAEGP